MDFGADLLLIALFTIAIVTAFVVARLPFRDRSGHLYLRVLGWYGGPSNVRLGHSICCGTVFRSHLAADVVQLSKTEI